MKLSLFRMAAFSAAVLSTSFLSSLRAELPSAVVEVLEASLQASGGREVLESIKSSRLKGTFAISSMGMSGTTEIVQAYPDKVYLAQELPGMGRIVQAFDGEIGWAEDPMQGYRRLSEGEIAALKQNESFADMLDFEAAFSAGDRLADAEIDGEAVSVVKLVAASSGEEETRYYSKGSGLLLRIDTVADMGPMGKLPASMYIKSYQSHEGVTFPASMEMKNAGMLITMTFGSLEINPAIEDTLFASPQ